MVISSRPEANKEREESKEIFHGKRDPVNTKRDLLLVYVRYAKYESVSDAKRDCLYVKIDPLYVKRALLSSIPGALYNETPADRTRISHAPSLYTRVVKRVTAARQRCYE